MKELFVVYNKGTGFIDGGAGFIDCEWDKAHKDGSTMSERIPEILAKDPDRKIIFLPNQMLPDFEKYKIKNGAMVEMTEEDIQVMEAAKSKSEVELLKERVEALEDSILK